MITPLPRWRLRLAAAVQTQQYVVIVGSDLGDSEFIPITTLNEASARYRAFIEANNLGGSQAGSCHIYSGGQIVAHVSYNGRVWGRPSPRDWQPGDKPIYDPTAVAS